MKQIALRLDDDMAEAIDKARDGMPRERWIKQALGAALAGSGAPAEVAPVSARPPSAAPPRASAKAPPVNHAMERQRRLNDAKYGTKR